MRLQSLVEENRGDNLMLNQPSLEHPIKKGKILRVQGDTCWIELENQMGMAILYQEESQARDKSETLENIPEYQIGESLTIYLKRQQPNQKWHVNERWAHHNPWENLQLEKGEEVSGTVIRMELHGGYVVRLDKSEIEVWLPEKQLPWEDGSLGEISPTEHKSRFSLEIDDRIKAVVTEIHYPPVSQPVISLRRYLEQQARQEKMGREPLPPFRTPLRYLARIEGDLDAFQQRLFQKRPLVNKKFLIIDDDKPALEALVTLLEVNGAKVRPVHVVSQVNEQLPTIRHWLAKEHYDLVLIDYNLPTSGEGGQLARHLKEEVSNVPMVLFTGDSLKGFSQEVHSPYIQGLLRRPLQLDKLLACLQGETVWELDESSHLPTSPSVASGHSYLTRGTQAFELLDSAVQRLKLRYGVLLKIVSPHRLEVMYQTGPTHFPTDPQTWHHLLMTSELRQLAKGLKSEFQMNPHHHGNDGLKPYSHLAHFLTLGSPRHPTYILGFGWEGHHPAFTSDHELWAFALLIQARLEQHSFQEWLYQQLPFLVQGHLLSGLTHEIRGRFSPWLHYQQALLELWQQYKYSSKDKQPAIESDIEKVLTGLQTAYVKLDELTSLMLSGLRRGDVKTSVKSLLDIVKQLFTGDLRQKGILLQIAPAPDLTLGFSPIYLLQPLSNLILNSRKHIHRPTGGLVEVLTRLEEIEQNQQRQMKLCIYVSDNGPGIPAHIVPYIFEPGFSTATKEEERTGMGLYISRLLVQQIGGSIELIEIWRGIGCIFGLRLPLILG